MLDKNSVSFCDKILQIRSNKLHELNDQKRIKDGG